MNTPGTSGQLSTDALQRLETRITQLEREITVGRRSTRRYRWAAMSMGAVLTASLLIAANGMNPLADVIQARRIEIVNEHGQVVLAASSAATGGQLDVWSNAARNVIRAGVNEHGGDLAVWNNAGRSTFGAFCTQTGGEVDLWNAEGGRTHRFHADSRGGRMSVHAGTELAGVETFLSDSGGGINVNDKRGAVQFAATASDTGGATQINNAAGARAFQVSADTDGCGRLDVGNENGVAVCSINALKSVGSALALMGPSGKKLFAVGTRPQGGLMNILNSAGVPVFIAGYAEDNRGGALSIKNNRGIQIISLGPDDKERGSLSVWDADGKKSRTTSP